MDRATDTCIACFVKMKQAFDVGLIIRYTAGLAGASRNRVISLLSVKRSNL